MNKVFFIGNLTHDPELRQTASGHSLCRFAIAVARPYANQEGERQTDFFECSAWHGVGESISRHVKKGNKVAVSGSIQLRNYEDNQGVKRTAVDVVVQECEFLTPKQREEFEEQEPPRRKKPTLEGFDDDSDIPF